MMVAQGYVDTLDAAGRAPEFREQIVDHALR
jgi:hypothetical protein